jgi:glycosyltransferase involved in cell wall biosynthesis
MRLMVAAPNIFSGDAVGNHCLGIARMAARLGIECKLFAQGFDAASKQVNAIDDIFSNIGAEDTLLLSHSIFDPNFNRLIALPCRKICYFHGITSPQLLDGLAPELADLCRKGLEQVTQFGIFDELIVNSEHTLAAISQLVTIKNTWVIPPIFSDMPAFQQHSPYLSRCYATSVRMISVGRVVPHKRIEDAITLLHGTRARSVDAELTIVGSLPDAGYFQFLIGHARELKVLNKVHFSGALADCDLFRIYQSSDILVITSLHEGFCVPVVEAQNFKCGVLVRSGTAAEYLAAPEETFEMESDIYPDTFFEALQNLRKRRGSLNWMDECGDRTNTLLEQCSDKVWRKILCSKRLED